MLIFGNIVDSLLRPACVRALLITVLQYAENQKEWADISGKDSGVLNGILMFFCFCFVFSFW